MLQLYGHPFSSCTWKALIALYEKAIVFDFRMLASDAPEIGAEFARLWPVGKFPVLADGENVVVEASTILEYLEVANPGTAPMIPHDPKIAIETRMLDRIFDNYVMTPMQAFVADALKPEARKDPVLIDEARAMLDTSYAWLDTRLAGREWAAGKAFGLADCAAAGALFYADWVHPIDAAHANLRAYRVRLLARPSVARCVEDARPYRHYFPLVAHDRD